MGIAKLKYNGVDIEVAVSEVGAVLNQLGLLKAPASESTAAAKSAQDVKAPSTTGLDSLALRFLKLVRDHTASGGASVDQVMQVLGATHPKGVGSKTAQINKFITDTTKIELSEIYTNDRDPLGARWWKAGPKMTEAIAALSQDIFS